MYTNDFDELIDRDSRAVLATVQLVADLAPSDLARPTPCDGWTVYDLIAHMTGQQLGFAAAARGRGTALAEWAPSGEPYADVCADLLSAFREPGVQQRGFALPEIRDGGVFPAPIAISFHLVDNVVHAWDLAVATDRPLELDPDVVSAGLRVAEQVPNGPERIRPGAAFAPARAGTATGDLDRTLLLLGRDPAGWPARPPQVSPRTASR
jgi:uncharacterized protein (TIGR03086 family)